MVRALLDDHVSKKQTQLQRELFSKKNLRCFGSRFAYFAARGARRKRPHHGRKGNRGKWLAGRERASSVDGQETVGNSSGRALLGGSEIGSVDIVDGLETVGNSSGRAQLGRGIGWGELRWSETETWTSWTNRNDGK